MYNGNIPTAMGSWCAGLCQRGVLDDSDVAPTVCKSLHCLQRFRHTASGILETVGGPDFS